MSLLRDVSRHLKTHKPHPLVAFINTQKRLPSLGLCGLDVIRPQGTWKRVVSSMGDSVVKTFTAREGILSLGEFQVKMVLGVLG